MAVAANNRQTDIEISSEPISARLSSGSAGVKWSLLPPFIFGQTTGKGGERYVPIVVCACGWSSSDFDVGWVIYYKDRPASFPPSIMLPGILHHSLLVKTAALVTTRAIMSELLHNIPIIGRAARLLGWGDEVGDGEKQSSKDGPSFPDYMLDPDAVVSLVVSHVLSSIPER